MKRKYFVEIIGALFILLFLYTALSKYYAFGTFRWALGKSPLIGKTLAPYVAVTIPVLETLIALLLFFPKTRRKGLWASLVIMSLFTLYLGYMIIFTPNLPCNCGGVIKNMSWNQHLVFNIFFTLLAALGLWLDKRERILTGSRVLYNRGVA